MLGARLATQDILKDKPESSRYFRIRDAQVQVAWKLGSWQDFQAEELLPE